MIGAIAALDADVTSIEAARSHMEVLDDLNAIGFANAVARVSTTSTLRAFQVPPRSRTPSHRHSKPLMRSVSG